MRVHGWYAFRLARRAELPPAEESRLQRHLERCPTCRRAAEDYARQDIGLRASLAPTTLPGVRARALAAARRGERAHPAAARRWVRAAPVIAVLLLAVVLGATYLSSRNTSMPQALITKGYAVVEPQGNARISRLVAERLALAAFPGTTKEAFLATVRNGRTRALQHPRLCWVVLVRPNGTTALVPPGQTWLDRASVVPGRVTHVFPVYVLIDARKGTFLVASSIGTE